MPRTGYHLVGLLYHWHSLVSLSIIEHLIGPDIQPPMWVMLKSVLTQHCVPLVGINYTPRSHSADASSTATGRRRGAGIMCRPGACGGCDFWNDC